MKITNCRICKSKDLEKFLDLGIHPPSDSFIKEEQLDKPEPRFPLDVYFCKNCGLVQLGYVVDPKLMFNKDYVYVPSLSETFNKHFEQFAKEVVENFNVNDSLVIDIGSNDGTLLKYFKMYGANVLGVDPSGTAQIAMNSGINTINVFFNENTAKEIVKKYGKCKIITGTNVFAHINNLDDILKGVNLLLEDEGIFIIESPYLVDLIEHLEFDTIYHEHLSYLAIRPLTILFKRFNMEIMDVKRTPIHGGSIRIFVKKTSSSYPATDIAKNLIELEMKRGLDRIETYKEFAKKVENLKIELVNLLDNLKRDGKRIAGYAAPAKGNTLLNYCNIGIETLKYIADKNPIKHGLFTPGMHIPVFPVEKLKEDKPDYLIILAWNLAEEIMKQQDWFKKEGGKFIIPIPTPRIV